MLSDRSKVPKKYNTEQTTTAVYCYGFSFYAEDFNRAVSFQITFQRIKKETGNIEFILNQFKANISLTF